MTVTKMVDPKDLTPAQRRVLAAIGYYARCHRQPGGWVCGPNAFSAGMAQALTQKGLIRQTMAAGKATLILTGQGRDTLNVWQFRLAEKERKTA